MPFIDDARRWIGYHTSHDDPADPSKSRKLESPNKALRWMERKIDRMTPEERTGQVEQIRAAAVAYHEGLRNEKIPEKIIYRIQNLEERVQRLNNVDAAWEVLRRHGGPPTKATVQAALERSYKERGQGQDRSYTFVSPAKDSVVRPSASLAMDASGPKEERSMGMGYHGA